MARHKKPSRRRHRARRSRASRRQVKTALREMLLGGAPTTGLEADGQPVRHHRRASFEERRRRREASLRTEGLRNPVIATRQGDRYEILDGSLRCQLLSERGSGTVPCLVETRPTPGILSRIAQEKLHDQ
jgi:hypothetical protein